MLLKLSACLLLAVTWNAAARADDVFLWPDGSGDYPSIASAVLAVPGGSTVYLLSGTYDGPGNRDVALSGKNVSLRAFGGAVVIDCQSLGRALDLGPGVGPSTVIDGIEFRNGLSGSDGGAIECSSAGPTIRNCTFTGNSAARGGAISCEGEPTPLLQDCMFSDNSAGQGGALFASGAALLIERVTTVDNRADFGGAVAFEGCSAEIVRCTLCRNRASSGAAVSMVDSDASIDRCIIAYNAEGDALTGEEDSVTAYSCIFANAGGDEVGGSAHDNYVADPLLCGIESGDCHLCLNSYCLPSGNPWGYHIGHQAQGCMECDSPVSSISWGAVKALYRRN